jgi:flavin reductase (DIM6/NTAB) family NADH-FMN oxidoreductase RutF
VSPDPQAFRQAFARFPTGVAVVTVQFGRERHGMTVNSLTSVSLEPLLLLLCLHRGSRTRALVATAGAFAVNLLGEHQEAVARHFAGQTVVPRPEVQVVPWEGGPRLVDAPAAFGCRLERLLPAGDHDVAVGAVVAVHLAPDPAPPLLFMGGRFARAPRAAWPPPAGAPPVPLGEARIFYDEGGE